MRAVGFLLILLSLPAFIAWLKAEPKQRKWAYAAVGILPFTINILNLDVAFINWAGWPGYAKGLIVTLLDMLALAIIAVSRQPFHKLPFVGLFLLYITAAAVSMAFSESAMSSFFYVFQLIRIFILYVAVSAFVAQPGAIRWLAIGLAAGALIESAVTLQQHFSGIVQASGTMGHQNLLGLMLHFVTLPLLALVLAGERSKLIMAGIVAALIAVALGASRGSVGFAGIGVLLVVAISLLRRATARKWQIVGAATCIALLILPVALRSFERRFNTAPIFHSSAQGEYDERAAFERAARMIWKDHPMGVGANEYVIIANTGGYSAAAGVTWIGGSRSTNVHNIYLLIGAETGWYGLMTFIALIGWPVLKGINFAFRNRKDPRGDIVMGASVAILATAIHSFYEWVFIVYQAQYMLAIAMGIIAGMIRQGNKERSYFMAARRKRAMEDAATGAATAPAAQAARP